DYVNVESLAIDGDVGPSGSQLWLSDFGTLTVGGDLLADVEMQNSLGASNAIVIGEGLAGAISLPSSGLMGQIIINNSNASGAWTGTVDVGGTPLPVGYAATASSLGGGSAGLVPFTLHD